MSPDVERLIGRAVTNKEFRDKLLADPEGAVKEAGLQLSAEEITKVKASVKGKSSKQVDEQVAALRSRW
jgi:hypothetical protein